MAALSDQILYYPNGKTKQRRPWKVMQGRLKYMGRTYTGYAECEYNGAMRNGTWDEGNWEAELRGQVEAEVLEKVKRDWSWE